MSWRRHLAKLGALLRRPKPADDLDEEIRSHLRMEAQENLQSGMSADEARYAALRRFGNVTLAEERSREMWGWNWLETLVQDVRYGLRMLVRNPGFAAVAVLSLALGIGANALIFSLVNALLIRPFPVQSPDRLVFFQGKGFTTLSFPTYRDIRDRNKTLSGVVGYRLAPMELESSGGATRIWGLLATGNYFAVLGVHPAVGRFFLPA
jgi:hypothetical protein